MIEVRQTEQFRAWLDASRDGVAVKAIKRRIARIQVGLFGDTKSLGGRIYEPRIDHGPGYGVYFARRGETLLLLLCGGDKGSQTRDIARGEALADQWMEPSRWN